MNDKQHGEGKYLDASGAVYEGGWERGKMHGMGRYTTSSNSQFDGMFRWEGVGDKLLTHGSLAKYRDLIDITICVLTLTFRSKKSI